MPTSIFSFCIILALIISVTGCGSAGATGVSPSNSTAPFRITRSALPQHSTLSQLDGLCSGEFGTEYLTMTTDEASGLTSINLLQVFSYSFDRSTGQRSVNCSDAYCTVLCIRK